MPKKDHIALDGRQKMAKIDMYPDGMNLDMRLLQFVQTRNAMKARRRARMVRTLRQAGWILLCAGFVWAVLLA